mmetsp:Transcript_9276/g.10592  ORF Transcript_9276/g.10592 Transcript_9276/m.10592 type:complete len:621 (-) Transcript_9276:206-2068(-)
MELPFAVESPVDSSLQQSESSSLVTASSQGSFMNSSIPLVPNTPQDIVLPSQNHEHHQHQHQHQHHQGQLVVIPASQEHNNIIKEGGRVDQDFTYVNVTEIDVDENDIFFEGVDITLPQDQSRGDVLANLLGEMQQDENNSFLSGTESANKLASQASEAKKLGDLLSALDYHTQAAKLYRDNAMIVRDRNPPLASSLLLLSQTQAKSAIALKSIVVLNPTELRQIFPPSSRECVDANTSTVISQKDRLRAAVRGALSSRHPHEADISDSTFLGSTEIEIASKSLIGGTMSSTTGCREYDYSENNSNPVDEMMELERELRDMDMALELGNSISSLDVRMQNRMKSSMIGESFMVVPGSSSYMSSTMWGSGHAPNNARQTTVPTNNPQQGIRARANRVQNMLEATTCTTATSRPPNHQLPTGTTQTINSKNTSGLESSWWGNASTTSHVLTSSVNGQSSSANTKQIMRLMDSLKTLGDENAVLLREVEELEVARSEANAARETMKRFKTEYGKRFSSLKKALEKFREDRNSNGSTPVSTSNFMKNANASDQLQRQEQLIRKLTLDLKKEKEESKKKDSALKKYECFYREVKARSAQKAALRQTQQQRQGTKSRNNSSRSTEH